VEVFVEERAGLTERNPADDWGCLPGCGKIPTRLFDSGNEVGNISLLPALHGCAGSSGFRC